MTNPFVQRSNALSSPQKKKIQQSRKLIKMLYAHGSLAVADISKAIGISVPSAARLIEEMIEAGFIESIGQGISGGGRRPQLFALKAEGGMVIGVDIRRNLINVGAMNLHNQLVGELTTLHIPLDNNKEYFQLLTEAIKEKILEIKPLTNHILGIGIALPGLINPETGHSYTNLNIFDTPLRKVLERMIGIPVYLDNDARLMALAELVFGKAKGLRNVLCLNVGAGLGMGMILNGELFHGSTGFAGEFGHTNLGMNEPVCSCGQHGCLEWYAGGPGLLKMAQEYRVTEPSFPHDVDNITEEAISGNQPAIKMINALGQNLGKGLANLVHLMNPEMIILGGSISKSGNILSEPAERTMRANSISHINEHTKIETSEIIELAPLLGAQALVISKSF